MIATNGESGLGIGHYFTIILNLFVCLFIYLFVCLFVLCSFAISSQILVLQGSNFQGLMIIIQGWF